jgi:hypothetical protein
MFPRGSQHCVKNIYISLIGAPFWFIAFAMAVPHIGEWSLKQVLARTAFVRNNYWKCSEPKRLSGD